MENAFDGVTKKTAAIHEDGGRCCFCEWGYSFMAASSSAR